LLDISVATRFGCDDDDDDNDDFVTSSRSKSFENRSAFDELSFSLTAANGFLGHTVETRNPVVSTLLRDRVAFYIFQICRDKVADKWRFVIKPNSITLASSELAPNMLGASSELASVMEFGREPASSC